jgi:hypothetical protein
VPGYLTTDERIAYIRRRPMFAGWGDDARPFLETARCEREVVRADALHDEEPTGAVGRTPNSLPTCFTSTFWPLYVKLELRAITKNQRMRESDVMISSTRKPLLQKSRETATFDALDRPFVFPSGYPFCVPACDDLPQKKPRR